MRSVSQTLTLVANYPTLVFSCPIADFSNLTINSLTNGVYLGGQDVSTSVGLPLNLNDLINFAWQDFRTDDSGMFQIFAICGTAATINILAWRR